MHGIVAALILLIASIGAAGSQETKSLTLREVEFRKKFDSEAILVRTCPGDPRYATGPTAAAQRVYRFEKELWYLDVTRYRKIEATPENVCDILTPPRKN